MSVEIEFKLKPMEGFSPKAGNGMIDKRLLTGEKKLMAVQDINLWYCRYYDGGVVPQPLQQKFTNYNQFKRYVTDYFKKRNIEVIEE
jgi:hypothetical protein